MNAMAPFRRIKKAGGPISRLQRKDWKMSIRSTGRLLLLQTCPVDERALRYWSGAGRDAWSAGNQGM